MNDDQILINQGVHTVLIDTWWNVNVNGKGCTREFEIVLIDTWWNVNVIMADFVTDLDEF